MSEELKSEHVYQLTTPFPYGTASGEKEDASFITLKAPTSRNSRECAALKQAFFRAVADNEGGEGDGESNLENIQGADVLMTMAMSTAVDLPDVLETAKHLFTKGRVAFVEGEEKVPLTKPLLELMSQDDVEGMLGDYLVNFTLASSLQRMRSKSSKAS